MFKHNKERREKASQLLKSTGSGSIKGLVDHEVAAGISKHEKTMHGKARKGFASGGHVDGEESKGRMDRASRAKGGSNKSKKSGNHVKINILAPGQKQAMPVPVPGGAPPPRPMAPPMGGAGGTPPSGGGPMAGGPPGMPPGGMPPGARPFKAGGPVKLKTKPNIPHLDGGSGGGLGRLEKAAHEASR